MLAVAPPSIDPSDPPQVVELKRRLYLAELKIQLLEERLRLHRIEKYGPASERLSGLQLELPSVPTWLRHLPRCQLL